MTPELGAGVQCSAAVMHFALEGALLSCTQLIIQHKHACCQMMSEAQFFLLRTPTHEV
jgi:hypothetical protein